MKRIQVLDAKIHNAIVTGAELNYVGSITIDENLLEATGMVANQKVLIVNNNNGERLETYIIKGERGTGIICLNGAAARKVQKGDEIIIIAFCEISSDETHEPKVIFPYSENKSWKTNDDICRELIVDYSKTLDEQDVIDAVVLKMGRDRSEIEKIYQDLIY